MVPMSLRDDVLQELHVGVTRSHHGEVKAPSLLRERVYWPRCRQSVSDWCKTSALVQPRSEKGNPSTDSSCWIPNAGGTAVDILGPLPETEQDNRYVLVAGDYFTTWVEA